MDAILRHRNVDQTGGLAESLRSAKMRWRTLACIAVALAVVGCTDDSGGTALDISGQRDADTKMGGDADVEDAPSDTTELSDAPDLLDTEDVEDTRSDTWSDPDLFEECDCADPRDKCFGNLCVRPGVDCEQLDDACADGYKCRDIVPGEPLVCGCNAETQQEYVQKCQPECEPFEGDCNGQCNPEASRCDSALPCYNQFVCPEEMVCDKSGRAGICVPAGEKSTGEACESAAECSSGVCVDGQCDVQCMSDDDCQEGLSCVGAATSEHNGFRDVTPCEDVECAAGQRCTTVRPASGTSTGRCVEAFCRTSDDCESSDCYLKNSIGQPGLGVCSNYSSGDVENSCRDDEFRIGDGDPNCYLPKPCWTDENCPDDYECLASFVSTHHTGSFCGRRVDKSAHE